MAKISNLDDFREMTSNITSFSHAYLFNTNSLTKCYPCVIDFAKRIISNNQIELQEYQDVFYQIDNNEFDDLYIVNPTSIGINTDEIEKMFDYMQTKSLHENGRRVYIIYGFERLSMSTSNKILKFLEEPDENIYGLLMSENIDRILPTIISRCQVLSIMFNDDTIDDEIYLKVNDFLNGVLKSKYTTIAYSNDYFGDALSNRSLFSEYFETIEKTISQVINTKCGKKMGKAENSVLMSLNFDLLVRILEITNRLKLLIKQNINLNLLLDRYIIEVSKELI